MLETTDGDEGWGDGRQHGREDGREKKKNDDDGLLSPFPDLLQILSVPSKLSKAMTLLRPTTKWNSEAEKMITDNGIDWETFYKWTMEICNEKYLTPLQKKQKERERNVKEEKERLEEEKNSKDSNKYQITGGVMVAKISKNGAADMSKKIRRGMVLQSVYTNENGITDVSRSTLDEILNIFKTRPIKTIWKIPPSRKLDKDGKPIRQKIHVRFTERMGRSLGLKLIGKKLSGGVMIAEIMNKSPAARSGKLRKAMALVSIDGKDMSQCTVDEAIAHLSLNARRVRTNNERNPTNGILTTWRIAPSRNLSAEGTRIVKPPTPAKTIRRRWKRAIHMIILSVRAKRAVDRKNTETHVRRWLSDIASVACDRGYQWEVETTIEAMAWAHASSFVEEGLQSAIGKQVLGLESRSLVNKVVEKSMSTEDARQKQIAKYQRMAREYKEKLVHDKKKAEEDAKKEEAAMNARIQRAMERGRAKELAKLKAYKRKREEERAKAKEKLQKKAEQAEKEGNLLALLRRSASSKIKLGRGVTGLSRHWKKMSATDRTKFHGMTSAKLGLSPVRRKKIPDEEKQSGVDESFFEGKKQTRMDVEEEKEEEKEEEEKK